MGPLLRTPAEGADTIVWLAADPVTGRSLRAPLPRPPSAPVRSRSPDSPDRRPIADGSGTSVVRLADVADPAPIRRSEPTRDTTRPHQHWSLR